MPRAELAVVLPLGATQTLAWASSYYLIAILADPIARDTGMSPASVFAAFSAALLLSGLVGPRVGQTIDRMGGRLVLAVSNILFAVGLGCLALAEAWPMVWAAWFFLGLGMGLGLYDAAFATLGRIYGTKAQPAITGITLIAGFASTVGWPLTAWGLAQFGWREVCLGWAAAHLLIGLPLNLSLPRQQLQTASASTHEADQVVMDRTMWLLAFAFAAGWVISTAMAAHLPRLLKAGGASDAQVLLAGMLIGPAQVAARIVQASLLRTCHPLFSARLAAALHPIGAALLVTGTAAVPAFALLHGAGNGILTIARGTVPLAIYGAVNYGYRLGVLGAPARIAQAAAPFLFGLLIEQFGFAAIMFSAALGCCTYAAFAAVDRLSQPVPSPGKL